MQAFFSDDQLLHDPQQFMRLGRICKPADLPTRAEALMGTLAARGISVSSPPEAGRAPLELVHSIDYLDFLESAPAIGTYWLAIGVLCCLRKFSLEQNQ